MSQTHRNSESKALSNSNYQQIFSVALDSYEKKTGNDLRSNPLLPRLETCKSPDARLSNWLNPTVKVIVAFSGTITAAIGEFVRPAFPPAGLIFTGIAVLLSTAAAVNNRRDTLIIIFERIENVFRRLENYIECPRTAGMINVIVNVMVEVLRILAIATKEIKENRAKTYLKKLVGRTDIEDALLRLENAILEETRMAGAETLKGINMLQDMFQGFDERIKDISQKGTNNAESSARQTANDVDTAPVIVGIATILPGADKSIKKVEDNKAHPIQDSVEGVRDGTRNVDNEQGIVEYGARVIDGDEMIVRPIASDWDALSHWLSPPDPSVNLDVARDYHHEGTAVWFTESNTYRRWKEFGSVMWIYGKPGCGKSVLTSTIIQDIERISAAGSAYLAYYFFDFKDTRKQVARGFLSSILLQLCGQSTLFCKILHELFSEHQHGSKHPSDGTLKQCLKKILKASRKLPLYVVVDALDECRDTSGSGLQSSREKVLALIQELVELNLPNLRLCITSRPEVDIRNVLERLTTISGRVSLHEEDGQKEDITDYIRSIVKSDKKIMRWREEDKELVVETLSNRADGMFKWVSCQFEALRRCLAPSVRQVLTELPVTLDETYERILQEILKQTEYIHIDSYNA
ncbi:hypothetical protein BGY98DRAFT_311095 [Russula aff. rugulosa BPL654]|nr:hypothetical protein BGY98DRAFT_311095 [Russula aff. rugulosa BPL654]